MRLLFLTHKKKCVESARDGEQKQEGMMARCYHNPSDEVLETIHSRYAIATKQKNNNTLLYYRLTKSSSAHVGFGESLEAFLNYLICDILC